MMVNAAVFTCSICSEASTDICAYCTKDACSNHRCARCKRCSDCCECEVPLSAEEPVTEEAAAPPIPAELPAVMSPIADFLTLEESSVFAAPPEPVQTSANTSNDVFRPEDPSEDFLEDSEDPTEFNS
jgi:hypothetical protein